MLNLNLARVEKSLRRDASIWWVFVFRDGQVMLLPKDPATRILSQCPNDWCTNAKLPPHPCPYLTDVYQDPDALCTCCDDCWTQCAQDI